LRERETKIKKIGGILKMRSILWKRLVTIGFVFLCIMLILGTVSFAKYPEQPISYLIAFSPGGESDITARFQQKYLEEELGVNGCMTNKSLPPFYHLLCLFQREFSLQVVNKKRVA